MSRNVKYSDGTMVDGVGKGSVLDGTPGKDAYYTGYHYTKAVCETCGSLNTNMSKNEYGYLKNVYWLYDCAAEFTEDLPETVTHEYVDSKYHRTVTKGGTYCCFCYGTNSAFAPRFNPTWITRAYSKNCGSFSQYVEIVVLAKVPQKIPAVKHKITIRLFFIETSFLDK